MVVQQIAIRSQPISINPSSPLSTAPKSPPSQQQVEEVDSQNSPSPIMQTHADSCKEFQHADDISMSENNFSSSQDIPKTDSNSCSSSSSQDSDSDVDSSSSSPDELAILLSQQSPFSISRYYSTPGHTPVLKGHLSPP